METSLAIAVSLLVLAAGLGLFALVLNSFNKLFFLYYISALSFFLLGGGVSVAAIFGVFSRGAWLVPAITFIVIIVMLGSLLFNIASEERLIYKSRQLKKPISPVDVEKGLDWKKLEKWLLKNEKGGRH